MRGRGLVRLGVGLGAAAAMAVGLVAASAQEEAVEGEGARNGCPCVADLNSDGLVDLFDLLTLAQCFGLPPTGPCVVADIDCDGDVDYADVMVLCHQWATVAPFDTTYCVESIGACCWAFDVYPGGERQVCGDLSRLDCAAAKGRYVGTGTTCAATDCELMPVCLGDLDSNNTCDVLDFGVFVSFFGEEGWVGRCDGDFDGDGLVTVFDFGVFADDFGCSGPALVQQWCCGNVRGPLPPEPTR